MRLRITAGDSIASGSTATNASSTARTGRGGEPARVRMPCQVRTAAALYAIDRESGALKGLKTIALGKNPSRFSIVDLP